MSLSTTTNAVPWLALSFNDKSFSTDGDRGCVCTWKTGTSTMVLSSQILGSIDIRLDSEVFWMEVSKEQL